MNLTEYTTKYTKKNLPVIRVGDTVKIHYKITEAGKTRIQIFEGLVIALKHGKGLDGTIKVRKIADGVGVERTFPLHSPLISKFEKVKSLVVKRAKLYFVRDLLGKKRKRKGTEISDYGMWEEELTEEELKKIEEEKAAAAAKKAEAKAKKQAELDAKFKQAVASHEEAEKK